MPIPKMIGNLVKQTKTQLLGLTLLFAVTGLTHAGLKVTEADVETARKAVTGFAEQIRAVKEKKAVLDKDYKRANAKVIAAKTKKDEAERILAASQKELDRLQKQKPHIDKRAVDTDAALKAIQNEVEDLEKKRKALKKASRGASVGKIHSGGYACNAPRIDGFQRADVPGIVQINVQNEKKDDAAAKKAAEAAEAKKKADAAANAAPGFWRKRALRKGAKPATPGEKKWLDAYKAEVAAKKAAEAEAAKKAAEAKKLADAKKAEAAKKAALAKANEEPGFWRKRALRKGEKPKTPGEQKWLDAWKAAEVKKLTDAKEAEKKKAEAEKLAAAKKAEAAKKAAEAKKLAEAKKAEAAKKAALAEANKEPGFWRKRALRKGAKPETPGEKKWLADYKAAEAKKVAAELEAAKAEAKAKEEAAKKAAEAKKLAEAKKAEAAKKAALAEANKEPGYFRKRELKKGEKPKTPGEKKWLADWKAENAKEVEAAKKAAEAKKLAEAKKAEAAKKAAEAKKIAAAEKAKAAANAEPGFWRKRELKRDGKPKTPGETRWYEAWKAENAKAIEAQKKKEELAKLRRQKEIEAAHKRKLEEAKRRELDAQRKKAAQAKERELAALRKQEARLALVQLKQVEEKLKAKQVELDTAEVAARKAAKDKRATDERMKVLTRDMARASTNMKRYTAEYTKVKAVADKINGQVDVQAGLLKKLEGDQKTAKKQAEEMNEKYQKGLAVLRSAESARFRYITAVEKSAKLKTELTEYKALAAQNKAEIPVVRQDVDEATAAVVEAREAYEAHREKLYGATKKSDRLKAEIIVLTDRKRAKNKSEEEMDPFVTAIRNTVANLRAVEQRAKQVYKDADFNAYKARATARAIKRNDSNIIKFKEEMEEAKKELLPWGELDPLPPRNAIMIDAATKQKDK